jgi:hypothetical protein
LYALISPGKFISKYGARRKSERRVGKSQINIMKKKLTTSLLSFSKSIQKAFILSCLLFIIIASKSYCQTLDDFRQAAGNSRGGTDFIPYSSLRSDAESVSREVNYRKEQAQSCRADIWEKEKDNLLEDIKKNNSQDSKDKLEKLNKKLAECVDVFDRLYQARAGLREIFDKVLSQLYDSKSHPDRHLRSDASEEDKKKFYDYINVIESEIKNEERDHQEQEDGARKRKAEIEAILNKS